MTKTEIKCTCGNTLGIKILADESLSINTKKVNMHFPLTVSKDGKVKLKCRQCNSVLDFSFEEDPKVNQKESNRSLLDSFSQRGNTKKVGLDE